MKLLIVESPSKAKTIEKYLDGEYVVRASVGHVRDLPSSNKKAIDIPAGFIPYYEISKGKDKVVRELQTLAEGASEILLATDPDREGEAISWHLNELLKEDKKITKNIKRVAFNEITKEAILEALKNPREIDANLVKAQEARRVLDRLVGYDLSGLIWKKVRYGLSAGRVQSPALRILCEREREINAFIPETYFVLEADLQKLVSPKDTIKFTYDEELRDKKIAEQIITFAETENWQITDVKQTEAKRATRAPFTTSTLQQTASTRLGFSPSRTMQVAQKLYEAGHITYMRTDSTNLGKQSLEQINKVVKKEFGNEHAEIKEYKTKNKNAQEAHEAIRPTHIEKKLVGNNPEQKALYDLIWRRTVASQMKDAKILRTKISAKTASMPNNFSTNGSTTLYLGWLLCDTGAKGEEVELPIYTVGGILKLIEARNIEKQTEPPNRYSEAGLVKELEARGIGRPSTYASIISTILAREYVEKYPPPTGKALKPTDTGMVVSQFLEDHFIKYIGDDFTAEMENELDEIASGDRDYTKTLTDFYGPFQKDLKEKEGMDKLTTIEDADQKWKCPKCGSSMIIKLGRGGKFMSCSNYPECDGALMIDGVEIKKDEPIGIDPQTQLPIYVLVGRFGPYVQLGKKVKKTKEKRKVKGEKAEKQDKPRMASIPKTVPLDNVTVEMALKYLSIPRTLGINPKNDKEVIATTGRFGPYVACDGEFRSIKAKAPFDVYTITLADALALLAEEKKPRGFAKKKAN
ncbi:DNA topoisomerase I [Candidatus Nomurabacteria bacterium RIFCSPHIGHO2_02_FULL_38_15]|uniref:DNA topoisomerase 1 n=1 Tax=Candidatus Nomurabacteria bacterium RIFCSPHIGHO2_02_FULL_38_15 TaxID=1801752 RepID=A0A1F6VQE6_9BACT|nr:MAG: DNA topoisomerase I [Candidatus Nomurabacteria bacterium RIFCSPHIGHO2_02_FULL_38_15]